MDFKDFTDKTHYTHYTLEKDNNPYKPTYKWHLWLYMIDNNRVSHWYKTKKEAIAIIESNFNRVEV